MRFRCSSLFTSLYAVCWCLLLCSWACSLLLSVRSWQREFSYRAFFRVSVYPMAILVKFVLSVTKESSYEPDEITYNAAISACEKAAEWKLALQLLLEVPPADRV